MQIHNLSYKTVSFGKTQKKEDNDKNPISKLGERESLVKATVAAGLVFGARALYYIFDNDFILEALYNTGKRIVNKNFKDLPPREKYIRFFGACGALTLGFVGAVAALYTLFELPKIMYQGKVDAFKKGKDMDVYIKGNKVERELYDQMNDKASKATSEEKREMSEQYLKLKAAKNQTPDYIDPKILPPAK